MQYNTFPQGAERPYGDDLLHNHVRRSALP